MSDFPSDMAGHDHSKLVPEWHRKAVVYQIYPRSFKDSNKDGIGDIRGIIEKLDYLNDGTENSLGVGAIWLSPIYCSPMVDFGYDISDYTDIDPIFGRLEDFDELIAGAHERGIRVIMDFVPNHTSSRHKWFLESRSSLTNPKRDWYIWHDPKPGGKRPNNWLSVFGGSGWTWDEETGQYYFHSFLPEQPDLNWRNPAVKEAMTNVMQFWLERGVDGFRTDAAYHLIKDKEFRDDPSNPDYVEGKMDPYEKYLHKYSQGREGSLEHINSFCEILGEHEEKFLVSEAYLDLPALEKMYKSCSNNLHAPFNFNLIGMPWQADKFRKFIDDFEKSLSEEKWPNYVMGNHDRPRVVSRLGLPRARLMAMLILTVRGMPFIYYGDELGMENVVIPPDQVKDPWEKRVPGMNFGRDPVRSPMQWNGSKNAGFSDASPWLPVADNYEKVNAESEIKDPKSIFNLYRLLIHYRKKSSALLTGAYRSLKVDNPDVFAYERKSDEQELLVMLNFSNKNEVVKIPIPKCEVVCNTHLDRELGEKILERDLNLRAHEGIVLTT